MSEGGGGGGSEMLSDDWCCLQCGEPVEPEDMDEGVCEQCCEENQRALDLHHATYDRWEKLTDQERAREIRAAVRKS
jgi:predicted amidophosphoribosyltransferase